MQIGLPTAVRSFRRTAMFRCKRWGSRKRQQRSAPAGQRTVPSEPIPATAQPVAVARTTAPVVDRRPHRASPIRSHIRVPQVPPRRRRGHCLSSVRTPAIPLAGPALRSSRIQRGVHPTGAIDLGSHDPGPSPCLGTNLMIFDYSA